MAKNGEIRLSKSLATSSKCQLFLFKLNWRIRGWNRKALRKSSSGTQTTPKRFLLVSTLQCNCSEWAIQTSLTSIIYNLL